MHLCAGDGLTKKRSFILSSCHQVLSLGGVRADDNTADEERSSEINGEGCAHLSIHSSFFKKTSIHVILDVRMAKEKKYCSQAGQAFTGQVLSERHFFRLNIWKNYLCEVQTRVFLLSMNALFVMRPRELKSVWLILNGFHIKLYVQNTIKNLSVYRAVKTRH